mmetsp:Transcript_38644/g.95860  ORF Transcript_38644/g.95860 Transcript_38644/m.95860 type:complete len:273 (-) Transcript_38644:328-1146(-)|eukprot:CAMPEP_0197591588 /NCGR_PEP_ID=MMETSP1326-20131121/13799_1 /TAXON_ID=1155430 /ORGANISM="Genus nov. species nov., Strain RCC2288" /LENGTH=272 /DNA_ID=CAMNT_0043157109 /DNA_START=219 /DNA_END=1037 /DNA_ORIENTATION=-
MGGASSKASDFDEGAASDVESGDEKLSAEDEIKRVLRFQNNYYKVLKVDPKTCTEASIKKAYYTIARVIHPDKCAHPQSTDAMGVVTSANSTLSNSALRAGYDMYASQVEVDSAGSDSFHQWESKGGANMAHLPPWLVKGLSSPVLGPILMFLIVLLMLSLAVLLFALFIAYFVVHMIFWFLCCFGCCGHCWPRYGEGARLHAKKQERFMRMLQDYEAEAMMAKSKGEDLPNPNVFFANWNVAHPEEEEGEGIPTASAAAGDANKNSYGAIP